MKVNDQQAQLTFDVGGEHDAPASSTFRISGALSSVRHELMKGAEVRVLLQDADGQLIAVGEAYVRGIGFHEHHPNNGPAWTERKHTIKLEA